MPVPVSKLESVGLLFCAVPCRAMLYYAMSISWHDVADHVLSSCLFTRPFASAASCFDRCETYVCMSVSISDRLKAGQSERED